MNVLVISDYDRLAVEITKKLIIDGYTAKLLTTKDLSHNFSINISNLNSRRLWWKNAIRSFIFRKILLWTDPRYSFFQDISENEDYYNFKNFRNKIDFYPEVILILFDYRILTTETIKKLQKWSDAQIIWMIPDMKPMTGGCSYAANCIGYQYKCNDCPAIKNPLMKNFAANTLKKKIRNLQDINLELVCGSSMQQRQAGNSSLLGNYKIHKCFFPSDKSIFAPKSQEEAKSILGINTEKKIILFGATSLTEERKGMQLLLKALKSLEQYKNRCLLLIVGNGDHPNLNNLVFEKKLLGFVNHERLANAYQAADFFVCPTIDDSGPVMVSQSMMCGTPVISFEMGISLDLVENYKTGFITPLSDVQKLAENIEKMIHISDEEQRLFRINCINKATELNFDSFLAKIKLIIDETKS